jgi:hypothetical protein
MKCREQQAVLASPVCPFPHGGGEILDNLALACIHCNRYKGPNIAGIDSRTGVLVRLFHPRVDQWDDHFRWNGSEIVGFTDIVRATVKVLLMNDPVVVWLRASLSAESR